MKTLIFNGSPRKTGDTVSLINELIENLEGEIIIVSSYYDKIRPCNDCRVCWKVPSCPIDDEMQQIYKYIEQCDNIVIASPVYFSELTGSLLNALSRLQMYCMAKLMRNEQIITKPKQGAIILVRGGNGGHQKAESTAKTLLKEMNAMSDYLGCVVSENTDKIPAKEDETAIRNIYKLAIKLNGE